jgi:hypothetical protein
LTIARKHQGIGQTVQHVKLRWPTVGECGLIDLARFGINKCGDETEVPIFGRYAPGSAMSGLLKRQISIAKRQHVFVSCSIGQRSQNQTIAAVRHRCRPTPGRRL